MSRLLLAGYFGAGNLGDDAILLGFIQGLGRSEYDVTVMSGNPEETYRLYGLESIDRRDMSAFKRAMADADALVFPGGSIFQDASSVRSVAYYGNLVKVAKSMGKKVVFLGQGVGPLTTYFGRRWSASAFNMADGIAVRDPGSVATLQGIGVKRPIKVTADMAFLLPRPTESDEAGFSVGAMKAVGISIRPHGKKDEVKELFGEFARLLFNSQIMPVFIEMDRKNDGPLILEISRSQGGKIPDLRNLQTPMQIQQRMTRLDAIVAMRLHGGILASTAGIPPFMVSYDPKVAAFAKLLDLQAAPSLDGLTPLRLFEAFMQFLKDRERNEKIMARKVEELARLAATNLDVLREALGNPATI